MKKLQLLLLALTNTMIFSGYGMEESRDTEPTSLSHVARAGKARKIKKAMRENKWRIDDYTNITGCSALHWIAALGLFDGLKDILKLRPNLTLRDKEGKTVLFKCLQGNSGGHLTGFLLLVNKYGADLTAKDCRGNTLFHEAASKVSIFWVKKLFTICSSRFNLLDYANLLCAKNTLGQTAYDIAYNIAQDRESVKAVIAEKLKNEKKFASTQILNKLEEQINSMKLENEKGYDKAEIANKLREKRRAIKKTEKVIKKIKAPSVAIEAENKMVGGEIEQAQEAAQKLYNEMRRVKDEIEKRNKEIEQQQKPITNILEKMKELYLSSSGERGSGDDPLKDSDFLFY